MAIKISFITTVFNEEKNVRPLFESLLNQTKLPDEIIVVDAKSTDNTVNALKELGKKFGKVKFSLHSKKGNRSVGRNFAISKAVEIS